MAIVKYYDGGINQYNSFVEKFEWLLELGSDLVNRYIVFEAGKVFIVAKQCIDLLGYHVMTSFDNENEALEYAKETCVYDDENVIAIEYSLNMTIDQYITENWS